MIVTMENGDVVAALQQPIDGLAADELSAADDEHAHACIIVPLMPWSLSFMAG
jgi:hypothetical protein